MKILNLNKKVYSKNQYEKVVDYKFSQFAVFSSTPTSSIISIDDFFQYYNSLFFDIPKTGDVNSHQYLIQKSSEYINFTPTNNEIKSLIEEINSLQQDNLNLNQQLININLSNSIK